MGFFLNLQSLLPLCLRSQFSEENLKDLNEKVSYHNQNFIKIFKLNLQPKAHFLTHYVTVIRRLGPLKQMWSMRYEGKHKELKVYCKVNYSRVNICYSLAVRTLMKFSARFYENQRFKEIKEVVGETTVYKSLGVKPYFRKIRPHNSELTEVSTVTLCKSINYKGTEYKKKYFLVTEEITDIFEIIEILYFHSNDSILLACKKHSITFQKNLNAYLVTLKENSPIDLLNITDFNHFYPMNLQTLGGRHYCRPKYI